MFETETIDRSTFDSVFRSVEEAESLPAWCYTSEEYYRLEVRNLFSRTWNFFGHVDQVAEPGDFIAVDYVGVPILIVRGADGELRAFANNCRHRGTPVADGEGNCRAFTCPYHGWVYDLDGRLHSAPGMERAKKFDAAEYGLRRLRLETCGCFVFVNFDDDAPPLADYLGDFPDLMASYRLDELSLVRKRVHEVDCNWKVHIENAMEEYHLPMVHGRDPQPQGDGALGGAHRGRLARHPRASRRAHPLAPDRGSGARAAAYRGAGGGGLRWAPTMSASTRPPCSA